MWCNRHQQTKIKCVALRWQNKQQPHYAWLMNLPLFFLMHCILKTALSTAQRKASCEIKQMWSLILSFRIEIVWCLSLNREFFLKLHRQNLPSVKSGNHGGQIIWKYRLITRFCVKWCVKNVWKLHIGSIAQGTLCCAVDNSLQNGMFEWK